MDINYYYLATISLMYNDAAGFRYYYSTITMLCVRSQPTLNLHPARILDSTRAHPSPQSPIISAVIVHFAHIVYVSGFGRISISRFGRHISA
jgi:hypothetical protein